MNRNILPLSTARTQYAVNRANQVEGVYQPLYDFTTYPAAGSTSLDFFQVQQGQQGKRLSDTNMEAGGFLPAPKSFLAKAIEVVLFPGRNPGNYGSAAGLLGDFWNDIYTVSKSGVLRFFIGTKDYAVDAPLGVFPPSFRLDGTSALSDTTTAGATQLAEISYAQFAGKPYEISPVFIPSMQNFKVTLEFPVAVPLPSGLDARIGVRLLGDLYRLSQ